MDHLPCSTTLDGYGRACLQAEAWATVNEPTNVEAKLLILAGLGLGSQCKGLRKRKDETGPRQATEHCGSLQKLMAAIGAKYSTFAHGSLLLTSTRDYVQIIVHVVQRMGHRMARTAHHFVKDASCITAFFDRIFAGSRSSFFVILNPAYQARGRQSKPLGWIGSCPERRVSGERPSLYS